MARTRKDSKGSESKSRRKTEIPLRRRYLRVKHHGPHEEYDLCPDCGALTSFDHGFLLCPDCGWMHSENEIEKSAA